MTADAPGQVEAVLGTCECDFDPAFHRDLNARRGIVSDRCTHDAADHMTGWPGGVVASPALCMGCLFGCAP